jgi:hypothetical protein
VTKRYSTANHQISFKKPPTELYFDMWDSATDLLSEGTVNMKYDVLP